MKARIALLTAVLVLTGCSGGEKKAAVPAGTPGITAEPCPKAVNQGNGCIYLGTLTDLSGTFKSIATLASQAQREFWTRVNKRGGIGGYDIDVETFLRDTKYDIATHRQMFQETKDKVFAYAQMVGSPQTGAVLPAMEKESIVTAPLSWTSQWEFTDNVVESGASYCFEAMNSVDYAFKNLPNVKSVMAVYYEGDYGGDAAEGARVAATANGLPYRALPTAPGAAEKSPAIAAILKHKPSIVTLTTNPTDAAAIVKTAVARGFRGKFIGTSPTWIRSLLETDAAAALKGHYWQSSPWRPFATDSPGHAAMRASLPGVTPADAYVSGWTFSYPLKAALEKAAATGTLTRQSLYTAAKGLTGIDYEGILPVEAGNFAGTPNDHAFRQIVLGRPDSTQYTGIRVITDFFEGDTAKGHPLTKACFQS